MLNLLKYNLEMRPFKGNDLPPSEWEYQPAEVVRSPSAWEAQLVA